jgi:hypothetical protein
MRFDVAAHVDGERVILGHEWGERLRRELLAEVRALDEGDTVEVSFDGVEIVSTLTVSAFLVSMLDARRDGRPHVGIVVTDANEDQRDVIVKCLEFSSTSTAPLLVACRADDGDLTLLGKVDPTTRRTWEAVRKLAESGVSGEFRAADLAAALQITPQLANNRLARLTRVGALVRSPATASSGVREYVYRLPQPSRPRRTRRPARASGTTSRTAGTLAARRRSGTRSTS